MESGKVMRLIAFCFPTAKKKEEKTTLNFCVLGLFPQILPGVRIIIANPETKGPMGESHLGEVCQVFQIIGSEWLQGGGGHLCRGVLEF